ncbi:MAG: amidohydrolase [Bryobacterales bacterium]|nr:amidohydrolase [Bryobacterales bacterium]
MLATVCSQAQIADLVLRGGHIYTVNPAQPQATSVAVRGGRILAVEEDLSSRIGPATKVIELAGATVLPGLIDSHGHMMGLGESLEMIDLRQTQSVDEVVELVRAAAARSKPGEWIRGWGWDQNRWPTKEFPEKNALSAASPSHPVFLTRVDGHAAWVNAKALELAGINTRTKTPQGGKILRNTAGELTGVLIDRAQSLAARRIPPPNQEQMERRLQAAVAECLRLGLTSVHDAGVGSSTIAAYRGIARRGELKLHAYLMIGGDGDLWKEYLTKGPEIGKYITVRAVKLVADGALGSRGAAMLGDYADDPGNQGLLMLRREDIARIAKQAVAKGFQVATHSIGDRANRTTLEAYGEALGGENDRRFRVEHAQIINPEDFNLFKRYSVIASIQSTHATSDMVWAARRIGTERIQGAYAWRTFIDNGIRITNGSDFPVESPNPLAGFYAAITRQDAKGDPSGGWFPGQRMSREEALKSFTLDGAYAAFEETEKGSVEVGKLADLVVLSKNIMEIPPQEILSTKVWLTLVDGRIVYQSADSPFRLP